MTQPNDLTARVAPFRTRPINFEHLKEGQRFPRGE